MLPHALLCLGAGMLFLHLHDKVKEEEIHLENIYGAAFRAYRERTRRYL